MESLKEVMARYDISEDEQQLYGEWAAKVRVDYRKHGKRRGKLVAVTAMTPTERGEGKTTLSIALADALNRAGRKTLVNLREPSMGPFFGAKGGATGAGESKIIPEERINMHFTGDIHAFTYAANYIAAIIDNHVQAGNEAKLDTRRIYFKRCVDINDRSLRSVVTGLGGSVNGYVREGSFELTAASEITALVSLARDEEDLASRLASITVGENTSGEFVRLSTLCDIEPLLSLLREAFIPNFVMTEGGSGAFVHGASFANVAHGCCSLVASEAALALADIVVEEAGFGADLGFEKFMDIKCRAFNSFPDAVVMVITKASIEKHGTACLKKHMDNLKRHFNVTPIAVINKFKDDTKEDMSSLSSLLKEYSPCIADPFNGEADEAARRVMAEAERKKESLHLAYGESLSLKEKIEFLAKEMYGAAAVSYSVSAKRMLKKADEFSALPVCFAKTPLSFSHDKSSANAACMGGFTLPVEEVAIKSGSRFAVALCPGVFTLPGLPKGAR